MATWVYFVHPPRENFAATMTDDESALWSEHFAHLKALLQDGTLVLAGPTLGTKNTGIGIFEAEDEAAARAIIESDPIYGSGLAELELRPFKISLLRGRDSGDG